MSERYRALTRKYRPSTFDDIVSQEHVSNTLKNAIKQKRLSHAYLFSGPRGVGKTTMARVLARTINDLDQDLSGEQLSQTLNVVEIDAASNNKVDDIHHLRESVRIPPQNGRYKVFIIDEVHMLSTSAFNALLKTLEEPPDHAIFIFATTEPHKVLPTILSRVQRFDFKRIRVDEMVERLRRIAKQENLSVDEESLHVIAKKADGALRDALGLMDQAVAFCGDTITHEELLRALNVVSTDRLFEFTRYIKNRDANAGLLLIDEILQEGYDIQEFLVELTEHFRNLYIAVSSASLQLIEAAEATKNAFKESAEWFSADDVMRMLHIVSEAQYKIREAHQPRILFETTLLKLIHMSRGDELTALINELKTVKKKRRKSTGKPLKEKGKKTDGKKKKPGRAARGNTGNLQKKSIPEAEEQPQKTTPDLNISENGSDKLFGRPSLGNSPNHMKAKAQNEVKYDEKNREISPKTEQRTVYLHTIKEKWPEYIDALENHIPKMLHLQMQRVEPVDLKNGELTIRCNDAFTERMVDENRAILSRTLKQICGGYVRIKCQVSPKNKTISETETLSPYERFKKLQEKDPKIRTIVELFGAELDY